MKNDNQIKMDRVRELLNDAKPAGSMYALYLNLYLLSKIPVKSEKNTSITWFGLLVRLLPMNITSLTLIMDNVIHTCSQAQGMVHEMCSYV